MSQETEVVEQLESIVDRLDWWELRGVPIVDILSQIRKIREETHESGMSSL